VFTYFAYANLGITLAYLFVGLVVVPYFDVKRNWVKWAGMVFFITCGLTHLEMAHHALFGAEHHPLTWFTITNHTVQVVATWIFVIGMYLEFVSDRIHSGDLNILPKDPPLYKKYRDTRTKKKNQN